jgi:hypothetical protein
MAGEEGEGLFAIPEIGARKPDAILLIRQSLAVDGADFSKPTGQGGGRPKIVIKAFDRAKRGAYIPVPRGERGCLLSRKKLFCSLTL